METSVPDRDDLIDQETVEFNCHGNGERETSPHAGRIRFNRFTKELSEFGKLLDEGPCGRKIRVIDPADESQVVRAREAALEAVTKGQWPGHRHVSLDQPGCGQLRATDDPDQGRLTGAITPQDAELIAPCESQIDAVQHRMRAAVDSIALDYILELQHQPSTRIAMRLTVAMAINVSTALSVIRYVRS